MAEEVLNQVLEAIYQRRSVRQFTSQPIPQRHLDEIVKAGVWAPTGSNQQEVRFLVVTDRTDLNAIWAVKPHFKNPQAAILVYVDTSIEYYDRLYRYPHRAQLPFLDVGAACQNMLLAAHSLGLGACCLNLSPHLELTSSHVSKRFAVLSHLRLVAGLFLGYPARVPDLHTARHGPGVLPPKMVKRGSLEDYLIRRPAISRVLCIHSLDRNNINLGSQAISAGLRKALHQVLGDNYLGVLGIHDYHLEGLEPHRYLNLPPQEAVLQFREDVNEFVLKVEQSYRNPEVSLDWLFKKIHRRLLSIGIRSEEQFYTKAMSALSKDPLWNSSTVTETVHIPPGCVVENGEIRVPTLIGRRRLERAVARRLHRFFPGRFPPFVDSRRIAATFRLLDWAQVVLLDGDGNIADTFPEVVIRGLFNLALAKRIGAAAYSVNQTVDLSNPVLCRLMKYVYNSIDGIVVREPLSKRRLEEMGVKPDLIKVGADCAILVDDFRAVEANEIAARFDIAEGSIGLALRADLSPDLDMWAAAVAAIEERFNRRVVYFNSEEKTGVPLGRALREKVGITVVEGLSDYSVFVPFLSRFSILISQCYHPLYFAILARVPFVSLRGNTFKAAGLLKHFEYPIPVLHNPSVEQVLDAIQTIMVNYDDLKRSLIEADRLLKKKALINVEMLTSDYSCPKTPAG